MKKLFTIFSVAVIVCSCQVENINYTVPVMLTYEPDNVLSTSASMGGIALGEGGKDIYEYGIVYSTGENPTLANNKQPQGSRTGEFYSTFEIFEPGTTYYYRAYGINEIGVGYGETYSFTTQEPAPCNPVQNNRINTGVSSLTVNSVQKEFLPFDGNLQFKTFSNASTTIITLTFNEIGNRLPLTGTYTAVTGFDSLSPLSQGEVAIGITGYIGWEMASAVAPPGTKIYIENNDGIVTFIFCNLEMSNYYTLNGKYTYTE